MFDENDECIKRCTERRIFMKKINIKGWEDGKEIIIETSNLFLGSADFLRLDNMKQVKAMYDCFLKAGGNAIDTAEHYRWAEPTIGKWIEETERRDELVLFTKGCHPKRDARDVKRVSAACIREDIEHSLKVLHVDYLDMFALHRDDADIAVSEIMEELHHQVEIGHIHAIGVSNWELERIIEANAYAQEHGLHPLTFNSPNLSLARPMKARWPGCVSANDDMVAWHKENHIAMISWSSQAGGFFSGRFSREYCDDEEIRECFYNDDNWKRYDRCKELAAKKNKTPIQIALAWVLHQPFEIAAVIGPEKVSELVNSMEGADIVLTPWEMQYLDIEVDEG